MRPPPITQQVNLTQAKEAEIPAKDTQEKEAFSRNCNQYSETYKETLITQEPEKIMRILHESTRDDEDINESDENMYFRFQIL